jgi:hypothetical protein
MRRPRRTTEPRPGTALFDALIRLVERRNPFARVAMCHFEHGRALADAFIAARDLDEVYACIRFARRYGLLPEGCYLGGALFQDYQDHPQNDELDPDDLPDLRGHAWDFRQAIAELSVAVANVA